MLRLEDVHAYYGRSHVLQGISLEAQAGEAVCLLGRNGVGKTTTLKCIVGFLKPRSGRVLLEGRDVTGWPPHELARLGVGYVPETRRIFSRLTVRENLEMGLGGRLTLPRVERKTRLDEVLGYFPELEPLLGRYGQKLSGGQQQMLAIGRTLMSHASLLLIDEPSEGLAPLLVRHLEAIMGRLIAEGKTMLLVEQNARMAIRNSHRGYVLEKGQVCFAGDRDTLQNSEEVRQRCGL